MEPGRAARLIPGSSSANEQFPFRRRHEAAVPRRGTAAAPDRQSSQRTGNRRDGPRGEGRLGPVTGGRARVMTQWTPDRRVPVVT